MYKISGTTISLTRGDTLKVNITLTTKDKNPYIPVAADRIRFALKSAKMNVNKTEFVDKEPLITKDIPYNTMQLKLDPEDTKNLPFGSYKYDLQITFANNEVDTFISNADFIITPEVE